MIKVLLVDDSVLTLNVLQKILSQADDINVVGTASDGKKALALIPKLQPDVICTDLQMPVMDGLAFTKAVMQEFARPILVVSTAVQTTDVTNIFNLMQAGAIDVIAKPSYGLTDIADINAKDLISKIRVLSGVHVIKKKKRPLNKSILKNQHTSPYIKAPIHIIAIGASTGGPQALRDILSRLPADFSLPIVCVQHISTGFSNGLVQWIDQDCKLSVQFAETGISPQAGTIYFAPDDKQLVITAQKKFQCTSSAAHGGHRPAIDITFESVALRFGRHTLGILLTGMGRDGVTGLQTIKQVGGMTIAQDEASSIVYGMPKLAAEEKATQKILSLDNIASELINLAKTGT